jgi:hypothetical protein
LRQRSDEGDWPRWRLAVVLRTALEKMTARGEATVCEECKWVRELRDNLAELVMQSLKLEATRWW